MDLEAEVKHIFDSGANEYRVLELIKRYEKSCDKCESNKVEEVLSDVPDEDKERHWVYDVKCKRCNHITTMVYGPESSYDYGEFHKRIHEMIKHAGQEHCKGCDKVSIGEVVSYGDERF